MSVGYGQAKIDFDNKLGSVCTLFRNDAYAVQQFAALVATKQNSDLVTLGYTTQEAAEILTNMAVIGQFANALFGLQAIPSPVDVRPYMAPFTGVN